MVGYNIKIATEGESEVIELTNIEGEGEPSILAVTFSMNTLDNNVQNRADAVRCEMVIDGTITVGNKVNTAKLLTWSRDNNKKTKYRNIEINVINSNSKDGGDGLRTYRVENMFVIDYKESFGRTLDNIITDEDQGYFRIFIAQQNGNHPINTYSY